MRELVGERDRQDVVVQPLGCRRDPGLEAMALPSVRPQQDDAGSLDEQGAQVLVASFGDLAQDGAIAGGDLLRHEAKPGAEVAPLGEGITGSDGSNMVTVSRSSRRSKMKGAGFGWGAAH